MAEKEGSGQSQGPAMAEMTERVRALQNYGRSAQMLFLEHEGWERINWWIQSSIDAKDGALMKLILNLLLTLPTPSSQLTGAAGPVTLTIEQVLKGIVTKTWDFGGSEEETEEIKMLSAELFARWLRIKKNNLKEVDQERRQIVTEDGGNVVLVPAGFNPAYWFMAVNGKVSLVELKPSEFAKDNPEMGQEGKGDVAEERTGGKKKKKFQRSSKTGSREEVKVPEPSKNDKPRSTPKVFITSKSRSENLLKEMMTCPREIDSRPADGLEAKSEPGVDGGKGSTLDHPEQKLPSLLADCSLSLQEIENSIALQMITNDLGQPKKMVRWRGDLGLLQIHKYDEYDIHYPRVGQVKEKYPSKYAEYEQPYNPWSAKTKTDCSEIYEDLEKKESTGSQESSDLSQHLWEAYNIRLHEGPSSSDRTEVTVKTPLQIPVPDSPMEVDEASQLTPIPAEIEDTGAEIYDYRNVAWPQPKE